MSATDELRRLLDERGVEYETDDRNGLRETTWCGTAVFQLSPTAKMTMIVTPEQAIAATLGSGECEFVIEDNMNETEGMGDVWFRCTNCTTTFDYYADDWLMKQNYCPHCGFKIRKVVGE